MAPGSLRTCSKNLPKLRALRGDLALIFNYMKMLDPVQPCGKEKFANTQNSGRVSDVIRAQYNKVMRGERLSTNMRDDFLGRQKCYITDRLTIWAEQVWYERLAQQMGVNPRSDNRFQHGPGKTETKKPELTLGKRNQAASRSRH